MSAALSYLVLVKKKRGKKNEVEKRRIADGFFAEHPNAPGETCVRARARESAPVIDTKLIPGRAHEERKREKE